MVDSGRLQTAPLIPSIALSVVAPFAERRGTTRPNRETAPGSRRLPQFVPGPCARRPIIMVPIRNASDSEQDRDHPEDRECQEEREHDKDRAQTDQDDGHGRTVRQISRVPSMIRRTSGMPTGETHRSESRLAG